MWKFKDPMGPLWNLFAAEPHNIHVEVERHLHRLLHTVRGRIHFLPEFGYVPPENPSGKEIMEKMEEYLLETYGEFLGAHGYYTDVERMDTKLKQRRFPKEKKPFYQLRIYKGNLFFIIYWNFKTLKWEMVKRL